MADEAVENPTEPTVDEMVESVVEPTAAEQPAADDIMNREFEYSALGATRKESLKTILNRASQGYDYAQKMQALKERGTTLDGRESALTQSQEKWGKIDEYAQQNPDWYGHWSQAWESRGQPGGENQPDPAFKGELDGLRSEFGEVKQYIEQQRQSTEDQKYWDEVNKVKEAYPNVDLNLADENGRTLEFSVLQHAKENGIGSFRVAFRDFYHEKLMEHAKSSAKEEMVKSQQDLRKKGIIGMTDSPQLQPDMPDLRNMSESQILELAMKAADDME